MSSETPVPAEVDPRVDGLNAEPAAEAGAGADAGADADDAWDHEDRPLAAADFDDDDDDQDDEDEDEEDGAPARTRPPLTRRDMRSPVWIAAHFGVVVLAVVFVFLGRWQWHAGHHVQAVTAAQLKSWRTPEPVNAVITPDDGLAPLQVGQAVEASGTYDAAHQLLVPGRELDGRTGYYVLAPLVTGKGQAVVVNRGWLAAHGSAEPAIPAPPSGRVTVAGWAAAPESLDGEVNDNGIVVGTQPSAAATGAHEISLISPAELVNMWPYHLTDGYVSATDTASEAGGLKAVPAPLPAHGTSWDLLNICYAIQWCAFAVILLSWYVIFWRRELRESEAAAEAEADAWLNDGDGGGDGDSDSDEDESGDESLAPAGDAAQIDDDADDVPTPREETAGSAVRS